jgi:hypothetical protein
MADDSIMTTSCHQIKFNLYYRKSPHQLRASIQFRSPDTIPELLLRPQTKFATFSLRCTSAGHALASHDSVTLYVSAAESTRDAARPRFPLDHVGDCI